MVYHPKYTRYLLGGETPTGHPHQNQSKTFLQSSAGLLKRIKRIMRKLFYIQIEGAFFDPLSADHKTNHVFNTFSMLFMRFELKKTMQKTLVWTNVYFYIFARNERSPSW